MRSFRLRYDITLELNIDQVDSEVCTTAFLFLLHPLLNFFQRLASINYAPFFGESCFELDRRQRSREDVSSGADELAVDNSLSMAAKGACVSY
jgi:hypothetical protein